MNNDKHHSHPDYKKIYVRLLILLAISIWGPIFALQLDNRFLLASAVLLTAFGVGAIKAGMVGAWFMHLDIELKVVKRLLIVCILLLILLLAGVAPDVLLPEGQNRDMDPDYEYPRTDKQTTTH